VAEPRGQTFDLVLDLSESPLIDYDVPPPGYYAPKGREEALDKALDELPEMTGEFEKPKYFNYDPNICAHGNSGLTGCTRCIDACPTSAIVSIGDKVQVNPYLCQGGGSCVAACPSGAMTYTFPTVSDLLRHAQSILSAYRDAGGKRPCLLFHDSHSRSRVYGNVAEMMPESVLPLEVEEVGSLGMDAWMACLAYGADAVMLAVTGGTPAKVVNEIDSQISFASAILEGMGFRGEYVRKIDVSKDISPEDFDDLPDGVVARPARFVAPDEKRMILRLAIDHIHESAPSSRRTADLPAGAPFGEVEVDTKACTLCMGCVSVCPTAALSAGGDLPQLKFVEWNCVQCGLCEKACPEDAIRPHARFLYDPEARQRTRILHEEQPFCCISCGKPFATQSMLDVMMKKLEGHWMFQSEDARRRLQMCEHCRVKDMFRAESGGG
jgi:ferredoxin